VRRALTTTAESSREGVFERFQRAPRSSEQKVVEAAELDARGGRRRGAVGEGARKTRGDASDARIVAGDATTTRGDRGVLLWIHVGGYGFSQQSHLCGVEV